MNSILTVFDTGYPSGKCLTRVESDRSAFAFFWTLAALECAPSQSGGVFKVPEIGVHFATREVGPEACRRALASRYVGRNQFRRSEGAAE